MLLKDKTVFVTGASAGIGRATAIGAARAGADVAINYLGKPDGAASAVAEIEALGRKAIAIEGDVADPRTAHAFVQGGVAALGRLDVLVSNAGICPFHAFLDMPGDVFERTMAVNLHGASLRERGEMLISIAHPDFRGELRRELASIRHV